MKQHLLEYLVCPVSGNRLELEILEKDGEEILEGLLLSPLGSRYMIRSGIPRFVPSETYTTTFGFEWNRHAGIYFDGKDKHRIHSTHSQLSRKLGLSLEKIRDRLVLDVGCGTGANVAVMAEWGAREVFCV